jgi:hypothetical protein
MSDIPPPIAISGAQAGFAQAEASRAKDAERSGQSAAQRNGVKSIDEAGSVIETSDEDTAVFTDSEGGGGQGRADEESLPEEDAETEGVAENGLTRDDDGEIHLDIQA